VAPNEDGRLALPELEIEVGLLDGWVRFWHRGEVLRLPGELLKENEALKRELAELRGRKNGENQGAAHK
jgi:hypothetical protein